MRCVAFKKASSTVKIESSSQSEIDKDLIKRETDFLKDDGV